MNKFEKMKLISLVCSAVLLTTFTVAFYGHVYKTFGGVAALLTSSFFGVAAVISIVKLIKRAKEWQVKKN